MTKMSLGECEEKKQKRVYTRGAKMVMGYIVYSIACMIVVNQTKDRSESVGSVKYGSSAWHDGDTTNQVQSRPDSDARQ